MAAAWLRNVRSLAGLGQTSVTASSFGTRHWRACLAAVAAMLSSSLTALLRLIASTPAHEHAVRRGSEKVRSQRMSYPRWPIGGRQVPQPIRRNGSGARPGRAPSRGPEIRQHYPGDRPAVGRLRRLRARRRLDRPRPRNASRLSRALRAQARHAEPYGGGAQASHEPTLPAKLRRCGHCPGPVQAGPTGATPQDHPRQHLADWRSCGSCRTTARRTATWPGDVLGVERRVVVEGELSATQ